MDADEHATLAGWLEFYRDTLAQKCAGLTEEQLRTAAAPPSALTLLGLLQHMAEVERNWFRRVLTGEKVSPVYPQQTNTEHDGGFELDEDSSYGKAKAAWESEIASARTNCAELDLARTSPSGITLRWIYVHMIAEYARHNGHADLIRERIDGTTGV